ncbi:hypothetical protein QZH41_000954 [Actinostola sp. cb2023]|nr:hypothetical protein QZH41_000954 [Actinostola sp. cb2023]
MGQYQAEGALEEGHVVLSHKSAATKDHVIIAAVVVAVAAFEAMVVDFMEGGVVVDLEVDFVGGGEGINLLYLAIAQSLRSPITSAIKLSHSDHKLYISKDANANNGLGVVVGIMKIGPKKLFVQMVGVSVEQLAIDKPSHKFLSFMKKHYNLEKPIPQVNNFVVYAGFFHDLQVDHNNGRWKTGILYWCCYKHITTIIMIFIIIITNTTTIIIFTIIITITITITTIIIFIIIITTTTIIIITTIIIFIIIITTIIMIFIIIITNTTTIIIFTIIITTTIIIFTIITTTIVTTTTIIIIFIIIITTTTIITITTIIIFIIIIIILNPLSYFSS